MTEWNEFEVHINSQAEEAVSNIFIELGSAGVSVTSREEFSKLPEYKYDTLWALDESRFPQQGIIVKGYFHGNNNLKQVESELRQKLKKLKKYQLEVDDFKLVRNEVKADDWSEAWKKYYHPVTISYYLTIVPKWEDYQPRHDQEKIIYLDPGLAFGTGTHPTTELCLQQLEMIMRGGETLVDVGTGSGVLSIAGALLGAKNIYAYDVDDVAVRSAKSNLALNQLESQVEVQANDLLKGIQLTADIVVANIFAEIITPLIPMAKKVVKEGGYFLASGIILDKQNKIISELEAAGFIIQQVQQKNTWVAILAKNPSYEEKEEYERRNNNHG